MDLDNPGQRPRTRADLEAQLRALEEKRDQLEAHLAAVSAGQVHPGVPNRPVDPAAMLRVLEGILKAVQPVLGNMTTAREMLLTDRAEALSRNDPATATEIARALEEVGAVVEGLSGSIAQLEAAAEKVRASLKSDDAKDKQGD